MKFNKSQLKEIANAIPAGWKQVTKGSIRVDDMFWCGLCHKFEVTNSAGSNIKDYGFYIIRKDEKTVCMSLKDENKKLRKLLRYFVNQCGHSFPLSQKNYDRQLKAAENLLANN